MLKAFIIALIAVWATQTMAQDEPIQYESATLYFSSAENMDDPSLGELPIEDGYQTYDFEDGNTPLVIE